MMSTFFYNSIVAVFKKSVKNCRKLHHLFYYLFLFAHINLMLIPVSVYPATKSDSLTIIHITDTHICYLTAYHPVFVQLRQHYGNGVEPLKHFFSTIPFQMGADLVVSTGDNIDFYQAETANGSMLDTQIEQYAHLIDFCPVTLLCTLGNHDISDCWVDSDSTYDSHQYNTHQARAAWIRNIACFRNGDYYSRLYQVGDTHYRLIFLNNGYRERKHPIPFIIDKIQLDWLNYQLQESKDDVEILFMHIPLPIEDANQDGIVFSKSPIKLDASLIASNGLLKLLNDNSSVRLIVTGHGHKNVIDDMTLPNGNKITQIETAAFGKDPRNWRLIRLTKQKILISAPGSAIVQYTISSN